MMSLMIRRLALFVLLASFVSGCINSTGLIKVKPDGSGTIEQTMLVNMQALKGLMAGMDPQGQMKQSGGMMNEADFKRAAERMGVKPVSITPVKEGGFEGYKSVFAFDDISKIRVDQDPQMSGSTSGSFSKAPANNNPIRFGFTRQGGNSVLTITVDEPTTTGAAKERADAPSGGKGTQDVDPAMMAIMKAMFQGFKVGIDLEVEGKILKTNADYVNGSRVTLLEIDMAALLADEAKLKELQSKAGPGTSISSIRPWLKDVKGMKINHPVVTIEYR